MSNLPTRRFDEEAKIAAHLEALIGREDVSEDYVRFRIELLESQAAARDALAGLPFAAPSDTAERAESPVLDPAAIPFDRGLLEKLLADLSASLSRQGRPNEDLARLSVACAEEPEFLEELVRKATFGPDSMISGRQFLDAAGRRLDMDPEALLFFGRVLGAPAVTAAVGRIKREVSAPGSSSGHCPWCGSEPGLAVLKREDGKRVLSCSLCGEGWEFARMECPFCGNRAALEVLSPDEADPHSIETCDRCRGYLKTVDQRKLPEGTTIFPLVESVATLHLDLIAEREGCRRALPYAALR